MKITCKAMCKMLMSIQNDDELELLQKEVAHVCEAMLAFPWRFPGTRFHNGLKVSSISATHFLHSLDFFRTQLCNFRQEEESLKYSKRQYGSGEDQKLGTTISCNGC